MKGWEMLFQGYRHHPHPRVPWSAGLVQRMFPVEVVLICGSLRTWSWLGWREEESAELLGGLVLG